MLTGDARHENIHYSLDLNRLLKSCLKRNDRSKFPVKKGAIPHKINRVVSKTASQKQQNTFQ